MKVIKIKEKVLGIYPAAYIMEHYDEVIDLREFCIIKEPYKGTWRNFYLASSWWNSEDRAWTDAWDKIQEDMLRKLEE